MLYDAYEMQRSLLAGASTLANLGAGWMQNPANPFAYGGMAPMPSTVRFELVPDGAGTKLTVIQSGISEDMVMMGMTRGWPTTFDRLERALAG